MKKIFYISIFVLFAVSSAYCGMISKAENGILTVKNKYYKLSFFPGHILPFQVIINKQKSRIEFLDHLYDQKTKKRYYINNDRYAKLTVSFNNKKNAVIEATGTYSRECLYSAPGKIKATYRYTFYSDSPVVDVSATISREGNQVWDELNFLQLICEKGYKISECSKQKKWLILTNGKIVIGIGGGKPFAGDNVPSCIAQKCVSNWKSECIKFNGKLLLITYADFNLGAKIISGDR